MKIFISCFTWETGQCGNTRSTFLPCNNYLERSSGCSIRKDLALQFNAVASCFIPTSLASVGTWVSNLWNRKDLEMRLEGLTLALDKRYSLLFSNDHLICTFFTREEAELSVGHHALLVCVGATSKPAKPTSKQLTFLMKLSCPWNCGDSWIRGGRGYRKFLIQLQSSLSLTFSLSTTISNTTLLSSWELILGSKSYGTKLYITSLRIIKCHCSIFCLLKSFSFSK